MTEIPQGQYTPNRLLRVRLPPSLPNHKLIPALFVMLHERGTVENFQSTFSYTLQQPKLTKVDSQQ